MIRETARVIDQTAPHQLVVAKVLGALNCTDILRVIKTEGAHAFAATTDGMADMRGAADIVVSFDGGFKYGLAIEVKTTTQTDASAGPFKLFKAVKSLERNQRQFDRLINSTPAWWYLVVHIGKLTAKTVSEMDRALLDCPAVIFEGQHADATPDEVWGVNPLGELLNLVGGRLARLGALAPLPSPQVQLDMLDDVPVVTLDTPIKPPVWTAPLRVVSPASVMKPVPVVTPASMMTRPPLPTKRRRRRRSWTDSTKVLKNRKVVDLIGLLIEQWDLIGEAEIKARSTRYPDLIACYERLKAEGRSALKLIKSPYYLGVVEHFGVHDSILFALALHLSTATRSPIASLIMPEATFLLGNDPGIENDPRRYINLLSRVGYILLGSTARVKPGKK